MSVMELVIRKVASFQALDDGEEMMWQAARLAYRRTKIKKRVLDVLASPRDADWPMRWGMDTVLAVAVILNRNDVLARNGYTILEAMERINPLWIQSLVEIEAELKAEGQLPGRLPR